MSALEIPVFPLNSPLLPACELPLQIFEKRYLDMVANCIRNGTGFAVTLLKPGAERHEVNTPDTQASLSELPFYTIGTEARIVDFGQRENGLLALTIVGQQRLTLHQAHQQADGLWLAQYTPCPDQPQPPPHNLPELAKLVAQLLRYPSLADLRDKVDLQNHEQIMNYLIMFLPLPAPIKQEMLETSDHAERWQALSALLDSIK